MGYLQCRGNHFEADGRTVMLRGWAFGSWMNFEHFMIGLPGTHSQIVGAFRRVYGMEKTEAFLDRMLEAMVSEADIAYLKQLGVNSIRIPFGYPYLMDDLHPYVLRQEGMQRLDRVVQLCVKHHMYVILDLHSTPGSQNTDWHSDNETGQALFWKYGAFQDQVLWLWEQIASRYASEEWVAGYDVINEPGYDVSAEAINGFYSRAIERIRRVDPHHILFLEGTDFGRDFSALERQEDTNIAYTVHFYPFVLEADILDPAMDDADRKAVFTRIFDRQLAQVYRLERPIWCGESGYEIRDGQEELYARLLLHNIDLCEARGISWNLWTYKDARCMGIVIPAEQTAWMQMVRRLSEKWTHHGEEAISMKVTKEIGARYFMPLTDKLAYDLDFQVRAVIHEIAVEQLLIPMLQSIPWDEMYGYPDAFLFANCDRRETVVAKIQHYILDKEETDIC